MSTKPLGRFDHVGIAVRSIEAARPFYEQILGATFRTARLSRDGSFRWAVFDLAGLTIELLEPIDPGGFLARFIEKRGEGVHHITLQVPELRKQVAVLESQGVRIVDKQLDSADYLDAFISPKSSHGVLFQLGGSAPPLNNEPFWTGPAPPAAR